MLENDRQFWRSKGAKARSLASLLAALRDAFSGAPLGLRHAPSSKYSVEVRRPGGHHCTIVYQSSGSAGSHNPSRPPHFLRHHFDPTDLLLHLQPPPYQRPTKNQDVGRVASASATGRRSGMKQSRLVSCQDIPFDHFEEAKTKRHPKAFEKAGRSLPTDIVFAIDFCLKHDIPKLASFRCQQMQVLKSVVKQTSVLNGWILSNAPRPKHVRQTAPNVNIAILCLFCDAVNMNHDLGRDFLYGFIWKTTPGRTRSILSDKWPRLGQECQLKMIENFSGLQMNRSVSIASTDPFPARSS